MRESYHRTCPRQTINSMMSPDNHGAGSIAANRTASRHNSRWRQPTMPEFYRLTCPRQAINSMVSPDNPVAKPKTTSTTAAHHTPCLRHTPMPLVYAARSPVASRFTPEAHVVFLHIYNGSLPDFAQSAPRTYLTSLNNNRLSTTPAGECSSAFPGGARLTFHTGYQTPSADLIHTRLL